MVGYAGPPIRLGEVISAPAHSLVVQSYRPREMESATVNADGYGAAMWLNDGRTEPALYRTAAPIWADPNQEWMNERLLVRSVIAAVRSATPGIGFELANVQPFACGRIAFAHNGFVTDFRHGAQRMMRKDLGREAYESIAGSSDSEHLFALVLDGQGTLAERVRRAVLRLEAICAEINRTAVATLILGDGEELVGVRWARGLKPPTLYAARFGEGVCLASEPLDSRERWREIQPEQVVLARPGEELRMEALR